ncbi:DUF2877 domain-containing protein [Sporosarcina trichiuri]|uniref:DUF2877 domain-containing protein n=1 Tax=Sporosarcina trichiuri TaxID=3056445 RepID=UPI0025B418CC|nr:DUF2877 domain-containing protein [Sporosarcina sp. 0.2-SM1T-5]WJY26877.1 DUF2877 domain-containing protein [Sporosarcina sp. 0.2-SM1T-5]
MRAEGYEQHIPLLLSEQPEGCVHSVFQNGANIRMGERLFFIGTVKNGQLPFGIHLPQGELQQLLEGIEQGDLAVWDQREQAVLIGRPENAVSLGEAIPYHWTLPRREVSVSDLTDNLALLAAVLLETPVKTGLDVEIDEFLAAYLEDRAPSSWTETQIRHLIAAVNSADETEVEELLRFFLGRGQGLTPSGDDHLVGLLAIDTAAGLLSDGFRSVLRRLVTHGKLTTDIGREYLLYALDGQFSSTVVRPVSELTRKTEIYKLKPLLTELLEMGHSSGADTVFGMLLGLLALRRRQEWQKK